MLANAMAQRCAGAAPASAAGAHSFVLQVRRLKMYNSGKAKRDKRGRVVKAADFQSKTLPSTRIQPDRRWFGNTRVIGQKQLDQFRTAMADKV